MTDPSRVDWTISLAPGQSVAVPDSGIQLRFDSVTGDTRCPADALCVQGGDAIATIAVIDDGAVSAYDLHTGHPEPVRHGPLSIALVELAPYPFSSRRIEPDEYRLTLRVTQ